MEYKNRTKRDLLIDMIFKKNNMDPNKFTIGIFSRIEEQKGQHLVLESISKINHDIQLFIIGHCMDVKYKDELIRFSSLNKISDSIVFRFYKVTDDINAML